MSDPDHEEIHALRGLLRSTQDAQDRLLRVAQAVLLFHRGGTWTLEDRQTWTKLTGVMECTTKSLCDFTRQQMAALVSPSNG